MVLRVRSQQQRPESGIQVIYTREDGIYYKRFRKSTSTIELHIKKERSEWDQFFKHLDIL